MKYTVEAFDYKDKIAMDHYMRKLFNGLKAEVLNLSISDEEGSIAECNDSNAHVGRNIFAKHACDYRILKKRADRYWNNPDFEKL